MMFTFWPDSHSLPILAPLSLPSDLHSSLAPLPSTSADLGAHSFPKVNLDYRQQQKWIGRVFPTNRSIGTQTEGQQDQQQQQEEDPELEMLCTELAHCLAAMADRWAARHRPRSPKRSLVARLCVQLFGCCW